MSGIGPKQVGVQSTTMDQTDRQLWTGIAFLLVAAILLFGPLMLGLPSTQIVGAIAVLGLAAGAYLVGTADEERPV